MHAQFCTECGHGKGLHGPDHCVSCRLHGSKCNGFARRKARKARKTNRPPRVVIGFRMRMIADYVSAMPGCCKHDALRGAGLPTWGKGYLRPIDRALAAGLIIAENDRPGGRCRLFSDERARDLWHLRDELLHSMPGLARARQILAQIETLRAQQAADYAEKAGKDLR